jgi:hypothetical protein
MKRALPWFLRVCDISAIDKRRTLIVPDRQCAMVPGHWHQMSEAFSAILLTLMLAKIIEMIGFLIKIHYIDKGGVSDSASIRNFVPIC